jgi:hypothetical protein
MTARVPLAPLAVSLLVTLAACGKDPEAGEPDAPPAVDKLRLYIAPDGGDRALRLSEEEPDPF